ncbi:CRTAC1 family protein [Bacillus sp. SM2101]|uniref:CRTAC1 family protein n=1 Tax=Bacillus sp. SM2101 TaxID=2805366 RepID=UPI001BDF16D3|nr:CRTAC1 family protein [Bacillus sp. SM2101]
MRKRTNKLLFIPILTLMVLLSACNQEPKGKDYGVNFQDITKESGIEFTHNKAKFDDKVNNVMPWLTSTGAGVYLNDYDKDGFVDVYLINSKKGTSNYLYKNNQDGTFTDVTSGSGIGLVNNNGISETALWFDYDNDGWQDLFVGAWGKSQLFKNNGDGTFNNVTKESNIDVFSYAADAITFDYNKDGNLDLYVGNYFRDEINLWDLNTTKIFHDDFESARNGGDNYLFKNNGDGTFSDVSKELGVDDTGWTLATGSVDLNKDGWPDLYNANDFGPDSLYMNQDGKGFKKIVQDRGIGDDNFKSMNVDFADVFHDGNFANYISNISKEKYLLEGNQLWHMNDNGTYVDRAQELGVKLAGWSWGARFFDVNNSGNMSLVVTNGYISANKDKTYWFDMGTLATTPGNIVEDAKNWPAMGDKSMSGYEQKAIFLNENGKFHNIASEVGIDFRYDGRGVAVGDLDNNGTLDLIFANQSAPAKVYSNNQHNEHNWIKIDLTGVFPSNVEAIGTRLTFTNNGVKTVIEKDGGNSFGAQSDPRVHLGLGKSTALDQLEIMWPSGEKQVFKNIRANQIISVTEGNDSYDVIKQEQVFEGSEANE